MNERELQLTQEYISDKKFVILNSYVTHMRLNYNLGYTNERAVENLSSLGLTRKRIAFDTYKGNKQSRKEFINVDSTNDEKPVIGKLVTHGQAVHIVASKVIAYIRDTFVNSKYAKGIINFNIYNSDEGLILLFDNQSLKEVLGEIQDEFTYDEATLIRVATQIRNMSEVCYIRENRYTEKSNHVVDKKFYKYIFEGE